MIIRTELIFALEQRPTPQCHASTVVETTKGLAAAWFGGEREKHHSVGIWLSTNAGSGWNEPIEIADAGRSGVPGGTCWNPVLFRPTNGPLMLFYKVGFEIRSWNSVMMTSVDDGQTWSKPRMLENRVFGPVKNKPIELADGTILCPTSDEANGWEVCFSMTRDLGGTWSAVGPCNNGALYSAIQPSLLPHPDGRIQALCRTRHGRVGEIWSEDGGRTWSSFALTEIVGNNSGLDAVALRDGRYLLVNNPVEADWNGRNILALWVSDDGIAWRQACLLENADQGEFSYPAIIQTADSMVHITYTYLRESVKHVAIDPRVL